jgi:hypothetical protein
VLGSGSRIRGGSSGSPAGSEIGSGPKERGGLRLRPRVRRRRRRRSRQLRGAAETRGEGSRTEPEGSFPSQYQVYHRPEGSATRDR